MSQESKNLFLSSPLKTKLITPIPSQLWILEEAYFDFLYELPLIKIDRELWYIFDWISFAHLYRIVFTLFNDFFEGSNLRFNEMLTFEFWFWRKRICNLSDRFQFQVFRGLTNIHFINEKMVCENFLFFLFTLVFMMKRMDNSSW